jgi:hypothetical protein
VTCTSGRGKPCRTSNIRRRVSIGDSAAPSAKSSNWRITPTPFRPARRPTHSLNSARWIKPACSAISATTTVSVKLKSRQRSESVRISEVVLKPRRTTTSQSSRAARRTLIPPLSQPSPCPGRIASIGSQGGTSRPCNQAAVFPEKAADGGIRRRAAWRLRAGVSARAAHVYRRGPIRRQLAPSRCQRASPARFASATVNGPRVSAAGTNGFRGTTVSIAALAQPHKPAG